MRKPRAPDFTSERKDIVLGIIDAWHGRLTWSALIDEVEKATGIVYSRFTLAAHPQVAVAFQSRKDKLGQAPRRKSMPRDEKVRAAMEQMDRYKQKADRLEAENQRLLEQFVTWAVNAERHGVSMDKLNAALIKPSRDESK